jgi:hypothetical protein
VSSSLGSHTALRSNHSANFQQNTRKLIRQLWFLLVALIVLLGRLLIVQHYGVQEPSADSFNEIGVYLDVQKDDFQKAFVDSLKPNNEHHIPLTHWLNIALFLGNQRHWDLLLQACMNAILAALCALAVLYGFGSGKGDWAAIGLGLAVIGVLAPPFAFLFHSFISHRNCRIVDRAIRRLAVLGWPYRSGAGLF